MSVNKKKFLVIDDQIVFRINILSRAKKLKLDDIFELYESEDGKDALSKIADNNFDVITVDLNLPGMTGWEILEEMKNTYPDKFYAATKYVISAEGDESEFQEKIDQYDLKSWLIKPIDINKLLEIIKEDFSK
jgi:CheY-like chemotaxis protein